MVLNGDVVCQGRKGAVISGLLLTPSSWQLLAVAPGRLDKLLATDRGSPGKSREV